MPFTENLGGHVVNGITIEYIPASTNNYSAGVWAKDHWVDHWIVGTLQSAVTVFRDPNRRASTQFIISPTRIVQMVPLSAMAWGNGTQASNISGISTEHEGGWLLADGTRKKPEPKTHENSAHLKAYLESAIYETNVKFQRGVNHFKHSEISATQCCGSLDIDWIANKANELIDQGIYKPGYTAPTQTVTTPTVNWKNQLTEVNETRVLERVSQMYDIDTKAGSGSWPAGHSVDVKYSLVEDGVEYLLTSYSVDTLNQKRGFRAKDFVPKVDPTSWLDRVVPNPNKELQFVLAGGLIEIATGNAVTVDGEPVVYSQGTVVTMDWIYTHTDGKQYYLSDFSKNAKKMNGIPAVQVDPVPSGPSNEQLQEQLASLQEQLANMSAVIQTQENRIAQLQSEGVADDNTISSMQNNLNSLQSSFNELQQDYNNLQAQNQAQAINISELEEELANTQNANQNPEVDGHFWDHVGEMGPGEIAAQAQQTMIDFRNDAEQDRQEELNSGADASKWSWAKFRLGIAQMNIYNAIITFLGMVAGGEITSNIADIPMADEAGAAAGLVSSVLLVLGQQLKRVFDSRN